MLRSFELPLNTAFSSEKTAYEMNRSDASGVTSEIVAYAFISKAYSKRTEEKKAKISAHIEHSKYAEIKAFIYGYDPMNMFRVGDVVYCKSFVFLNENGNVKTIDSAVRCKMEKGSEQSVIAITCDLFYCSFLFCPSQCPSNIPVISQKNSSSTFLKPIASKSRASAASFPALHL